MRFATAPAELWCGQTLSSSASILSPFKREKFILKTKIPSKKPQIIVGNHHRGIQYPAEDLVENRTDYASYMWLNCAINIKNCSKHKINSDFFFCQSLWFDVHTF